MSDYDSAVLKMANEIILLSHVYKQDKDLIISDIFDGMFSETAKNSKEYQRRIIALIDLLNLNHRRFGYLGYDKLKMDINLQIIFLNSKDNSIQKTLDGD